jgi:hypothetical protein
MPTNFFTRPIEKVGRCEGSELGCFGGEIDRQNRIFQLGCRFDRRVLRNLKGTENNQTNLCNSRNNPDVQPPRGAGGVWAKRGYSRIVVGITWT